MCFCSQNTIVFSKNSEVKCGADAPSVSATGNQRQREGLAVFRVRAGENVVLLRMRLRQIMYLGMVHGSGAGHGKGSLSSPKGFWAVAGHQDRNAALKLKVVNSAP